MFFFKIYPIIPKVFKSTHLKFCLYGRMPALYMKRIIHNIREIKFRFLNRRDKMPYIVVDAGHGGYDNGTQYFGYKEKDINLRVATKVTNRLKTLGFDVIQLRTDDSFIGTAAERGQMIAQLNPDFAISIHINSSGGEGKLSGAEIITPSLKYDAHFEYYIKDALSWLNNFRMIYSRFYDTEAFQERLIDPKTLQFTEVYADTDYYAIIKHAWAGGVPVDIIEMFYLDNEGDLYTFLNQEDDYVEAIVYALAQTFGVDYDQEHRFESSTIEKSSSTKSWYRIVHTPGSKAWLQPITKK